MALKSSVAALTLSVAFGSMALFMAANTAEATHRYDGPGYYGGYYDGYYGPGVSFYAPGVALSLGGPAYYPAPGYRYRPYAPGPYYYDAPYRWHHPFNGVR